MSFRGFVRKEVLHILRDRKTLAVLLLLPIVQVLLFGHAIRTDVRDVRMAVVDPRPDPLTLELRNRLEGTGIFRTTAVLSSTESLESLFQAGLAQQAIIFEPEFASRARRAEGASLLIATDATDPNTGATIQAYAAAVIEEYLVESGAGSGGARIVPQVRMRFNPTLESAHLFVPGLIAFVLTIVCALMTAISLTRERELGTMEVLLVSPLKPWQIITGKVLPYQVLGFINAITVVVLAAVVFGVPVRGSVILLLAECLLFVLVSLGVGVLISTRTSSQRVAMTAALAGLMLPTMMLSGFIFPVESMPGPLQLVSNLIPARWFLIVARGIMLKGVGLAELWQETVILGAMVAILFAASMRNFKVRLA
jgi:ABC-2 type transport system permease protein